MRAFQLTPEYARFQQNAGPHRARWLLELDDYEIANLQRLLLAVGGHTGENDRHIYAFNNGDWVGQIGWYLPPVDLPPNMGYPDTLTDFARRVLDKANWQGQP